MVRYAAKADANQAAIVQALRAVGCTVQHLHAVGGGVPDLLVGYQGQNLLIEVKDGSKPPSARKKTDHQAVWHDAWRGQVAVVCNVKEALEAVGIPFRGVIS